jgi:enoyl-CoA hydratase
MVTNRIHLLGASGSGTTTLRRLSAYEQWSLPYKNALRNELRRGVEVVESGETVSGATSFARGQGRHGAF